MEFSIQLANIFANIMTVKQQVNSVGVLTTLAFLIVCYYLAIYIETRPVLFNHFNDVRFLCLLLKTFRRVRINNTKRLAIKFV